LSFDDNKVLKVQLDMLIFVLAKSTIRDSRVKNRILGFRLIIGFLENALMGCIYNLLWV